MTTTSVCAIRSKLNLFSNFTFSLNDPVNGDQFRQAEDRTVMGGTASQTWSGLWRGMNVSTRPACSCSATACRLVALYSTKTVPCVAVTRGRRNGQEHVALFSNAIQWTNWLRTIAGLRADFQRFEVASNIPANSGNANDMLRSPKLTVVLGPWAKTEMYLNWGRGFHSNDARGATITVDPTTGTPVDRVSPLVRTTGYEAGVRTQRLPGVTASLSLWQLRQNSELLFTGDAGTTEPSRASLRTGIEALVQYLPKSWITLDAGVGFTRARFTGRMRQGISFRARPTRWPRPASRWRTSTRGTAQCVGATSDRGR